jgi:hypothetical protein
MLAEAIILFVCIIFGGVVGHMLGLSILYEDEEDIVGLFISFIITTILLGMLLAFYYCSNF